METIRIYIHTHEKWHQFKVRCNNRISKSWLFDGISPVENIRMSLTGHCSDVTHHKGPVMKKRQNPRKQTAYFEIITVYTNVTLMCNSVLRPWHNFLSPILLSLWCYGNCPGNDAMVEIKFKKIKSLGKHLKIPPSEIAGNADLHKG